MRTYACALAILFFPVSTLADLQYGFNHAPIQKDPDWVDQQFFPVDKAWQLLSPVFTDGPDDPEGWVNGTTSPTTDATMSQSFCALGTSRCLILQTSALFGGFRREAFCIRAVPRAPAEKPRRAGDSIRVSVKW